MAETLPSQTVDDPQPTEVVGPHCPWEWPPVTGPKVPLLRYLNDYRHWLSPLPKGEPRSVQGQFLELEREGIVCLYDILNALVKEQHPSMSTWPWPWGDVLTERTERVKAWAVNNGTMNRNIGPRLASDPPPYSAPYGNSYNRARFQLNHEVTVQHVVTEQEAAEEREQGPRVHAGYVHELRDPLQAATASAEQVGMQWVGVFIAEVRNLLGDGHNEEHRRAFLRLRLSIQGHGIGATARAKLAMTKMGEEAKGQVVLEAFARIHARLNEQLDAVALPREPQRSTESSTTENPSMERLVWTSSTAAFAHIFTTLSAAGYYPMPRKGGKGNEPNFTGLARILLQAFDVKGEDGKSLTAEQLRVRLTDAAPRPLADTKKAKFQIPDASALVIPNAEELE